MMPFDKWGINWRFDTLILTALGIASIFICTGIMVSSMRTNSRETREVISSAFRTLNTTANGQAEVAEKLRQLEIEHEVNTKLAEDNLQRLQKLEEKIELETSTKR